MLLQNIPFLLLTEFSNSLILIPTPSNFPATKLNKMTGLWLKKKPKNLLLWNYTQIKHTELLTCQVSQRKCWRKCWWSSQRVVVVGGWGFERRENWKTGTVFRAAHKHRAISCGKRQTWTCWWRLDQLFYTWISTPLLSDSTAFTFAKQQSLKRAFIGDICACFFFLFITDYIMINNNNVMEFTFQ